MAAIYVDNVKVWPAGEGWYTVEGKDVDRAAEVMANEELSAALSGIYVGKGSTIDFLVDSDNGNPQTARGFTFNATVTYNAIIPLDVNASLTLGPYPAVRGPEDGCGRSPAPCRER